MDRERPDRLERFERPERTGTPPDIRTKLPEQQTAARPQKPGIRRETVLVAAAAVLLIALGTSFVAFALGAAKGPAQAVNAAADDETFMVQRPLLQVSLAYPVTDEEEAPASTEERFAYFYIAGEQLACALLTRKASGYKVLGLSGPLPLTGEGKPGIWMATALGGDEEYLVYGLLYDPNYTQVEVEGSRAVVVDAGQYRCWYYLSQGNMTINSESVVFR